MPHNGEDLKVPCIVSDQDDVSRVKLTGRPIVHVTSVKLTSRLRLIGITVDISVLHWLFPKIPLEILAIFITLWVHSKYDNLIITELSNS